MERLAWIVAGAVIWTAVRLIGYRFFKGRR